MLPPWGAGDLLYLAMQRLGKDADGCLLWLHLTLRNCDLNLSKANPQEDEVGAECFVKSVSAALGQQVDDFLLSGLVGS